MHDDAMNTPPTPKTVRVTVPVTEEVLETFRRLGAAGSMSTGRAMGEWLADTVEGAQLMASTMERARAAPKVVTAELHAMMLGLTDESKAMMDKFARMKVGGGPAGPASGGTGGPQSTPTPPSCNTGGKLPAGKRATRGKSA